MELLSLPCEHRFPIIERSLSIYSSSQNDAADLEVHAGRTEDGDLILMRIWTGDGFVGVIETPKRAKLK
jgi:hypothetical protein